MRRTLAGLALCISVTGCPSQTEAPAGPVADTTSPKDSPLAFKVLEDRTDNNAVEYHVLLAEGTKHDDVEGLLKYLYRYLSTRRDEPASVAGYVYFNEAGYRTPPRAPIAQVVRKSGENGPAFENRVPLEFWQEIKEAIGPRSDEKFKLQMKVERDDTQKTVTLTVPYTEPGEDRWADHISFNQAMNTFTDLAQAMFSKVPELKQLTFVGLYKDKEVVRIALDREDYKAVQLSEIDERIGQHHGTAFLKLATGKGTDKSVAKENATVIAKEYRAMLAQLKGKAKVDASLK
jgi:hypothetical protein